MKITKVKHHYQIRYRVNEPNGPDGKRQRKFFDSREAAERYVKERTADTRAFGVHVTTISATERAAPLPIAINKSIGIWWRYKGKGRWWWGGLCEGGF